MKNIVIADIVHTAYNVKLCNVNGDIAHAVYVKVTSFMLYTGTTRGVARHLFLVGGHRLDFGRGNPLKWSFFDLLCYDEKKKFRDGERAQFATPWLRPWVPPFSNLMYSQVHFLHTQHLLFQTIQILNGILC